MTEGRNAVAASSGSRADYDKMPGHWLLARMGKRVLRPGGRELTEAMLRRVEIGPSDDVVELGPGIGATTQLILKLQPASVIGVERSAAAAVAVSAAVVLDRADCRCIVADAAETGLGDSTADVVIAEALLTLHSDEKKQAMLAEAHRILRPGGRCAFHELCLRPDTLDPDTQKIVSRELSSAVKVGARPLTAASWQQLAESAGFEVRDVSTMPMQLLQPRRLINDEGLLRTLRIVFNILRTGPARRRVRVMRGTFRRHADHLGAVALVATKPAVPSNT